MKMKGQEENEQQNSRANIAPEIVWILHRRGIPSAVSLFL
jgi:hypothetical protein